jgi:cadmium resistance protein CadD (predicted permease)
VESNILINHIIAAIFTFTITNIDDLILLSAYFALSSKHKTSIVTGQYVGIIVLIVISLSGVIIGEIVPSMYIRYLGLVPIAIGLKELWSYLSNQDKQDDNAPVSNLSILKVASITIANGGDNIGVYTPLFASLDSYIVPIYVVSFLILTALWCYLGYVLTRHHKIQEIMSKYKQFLLPLFLIALGLWILIGM